VPDKGKSNPPEKRPVAIQRRVARNRQIRRTKEPGRSVADTAAARAKPSKGQPFARAAGRQVRGAKQVRRAGVATTAIQPVIVAPKLSRARPLQLHQISARRLTMMPQVVGVRPTLVAPKIDRRRVAQVSQRAALKNVARDRLKAR
jgi:hypothetical protein